MGFVEAHREQQRQQAQLNARMLYNHALLVCQTLSGDAPEVWEVFPLWTEEEIQQAQTERIRALLMNLKPGGKP